MNEIIFSQAIEMTCYISYIFDQMNAHFKQNLEEGSKRIQEEEEQQRQSSFPFL